MHHAMSGEYNHALDTMKGQARQENTFQQAAQVRAGRVGGAQESS
jgi:hypothetical protein